jgi:hypothetical protein
MASDFSVACLFLSKITIVFFFVTDQTPRQKVGALTRRPEVPRQDWIRGVNLDVARQLFAHSGAFQDPRLQRVHVLGEVLQTELQSIV